MEKYWGNKNPQNHSIATLIYKCRCQVFQGIWIQQPKQAKQATRNQQTIERQICDPLPLSESFGKSVCANLGDLSKISKNSVELQG